ncbi:MAG: glucokinase [Silicimonas sp.]|nr:glucokinase [Silicimonas sp.]
MDQPAVTPPHVSLVADVGGTNTRLALADGADLRSPSIEKYRNAEHDSLADVITAYLAGQNQPVDAAAVAIAGPVEAGRGRLTNLDWSIDEAELTRTTGAARASVLNDLQAQAHGLAHIAPDHLRPVLPGRAAEGAQLVIGAGTGFNAALALPTAAGALVPASECGHITLPVTRPEDLRLAQFVAREHGFASVEDVLSGRGIAHIHRWLAGEAGETSDLDTATIMAAAARGEARALDTVALHVRLLGQVAGDLALTHLPFGGVYLIGGVARAMTPYFDRFGFGAAFADKGRFADFMGQFPVSVIEDDFAALSGLAAFLA